MIREKLKNSIREALKSLCIAANDIHLEHPADLRFGDYSSNVALVCARELKARPRDLAEKIVGEIRAQKIKELEKAEVAGSGFINFFLSKEFFAESVGEAVKEGENFGRNKSLNGKKIMVEYTDPNPFKEFHIGHLMSNVIGESISRIVEFHGAEVKRACYQGDVGLHTAKAIYGAMKSGEPKNAEEWGNAYAKGSSAYEDDLKAKKEIDELNKKIYDRSDARINSLYDSGRKISLDKFEEIYKKLGTHFDYYFFESGMAKPGLEIVREFLKKGIFEESDGAVVFKGEKYDPALHTRVYITSQGLPTYETKELGLHITKAETYPADISIVITANEQDGVFAVGLEAFRRIDPKLAGKIKHVSHGLLKLPTGKMSSRKGNILTAEELISDVEKLVEEKIKGRDYDKALKKEIIEKVSIGAIKYSILRQAVGGDIVYDFEKSISFEGDSGPYLQYSCVRAKSVLAKAEEEGIKPSIEKIATETSELERLLYRFPEIVERAGKEYSPHYIASYLIELASSFNNFYTKHKIVDREDETSPYKIALAAAFAATIKNGLNLLGIQAPEKM
ncbi:MAG: arginine--tRNA ligase [Patescibacteria group bacterium]|nr:arginine--tRNA ligase [Patescibacteria group bacterium]MDE1988633.1 arginine--tRNA ligase [Patescibacteria group bacterium]MDE2218101.1 arginine--tRNA ligase [Patescibacteria group bacterium]